MPGLPPPRYAYLGPEGTFTEAALRSLPSASKADLMPCSTVPAALDAVRQGEADGAMVPLENSVEGSVAVTLDALAVGEPLLIAREVVLPVAFAVATRPGIAPEDVRTIATIPHAHAQVRGWLAEHLPAAALLPTPSTADGARVVAEGGADAAVCAPIAAERYGLVVLASDVHDALDAQTRFVLAVRPSGPPPPPTGWDRTSLVAFIADDHAGALLELLTELAVRGVNLTRIESRPTGEGLGRYCFSIDCEGHVAEPRVGEALAALRRTCLDLRFLGSYPRADAAPESTPRRRGTSEAEFRDGAAWVERLRTGPV
ncbi:MAG: prephenate dehydratase [Frankiales bacterium]|jgi:prephenate dehydratase|nr:prephenate dehydratase [Frankiales bacterium]